MSTALHLAVSNHHMGIVKLIVEADPRDRHIQNRNYETPIYIAAKLGYTHIVKLICDACSGPHLVTWEDGKGWTPLHYAAYYKFDDILHMMQEKVGYQFVPRKSIPPPLFVAVQEGHISTVRQYLSNLSWGSGRISTDVNFNGRNILHIMAYRRNKEMIKAVLDLCEFAYYIKENQKDIINMLNQKDAHGNTPLHILIREGCYVPEFIKSDKVDKNATNNEGWTPIDMLYFSEKVTDDQVRIRIEIDNIQAKQKWKFWHRSIKLNKKPLPYIVEVEKKSEFIKAKRLLIEEEIKRKKDEFKLVKDDLERYRQRTNTQIIVTALITTVTFTVGFTLPGGYHQSGEPDQGLALLSRKTAFKAFMVSDALALVLSTSSLFFYFTASMYDDPLQVSKLNAASTVLNIVSVIGMMLTFITGIYVVLFHSPALAITVCLICCFFFILVIVQSIKMIYDRRLTKIHIV